MSRVGVIGVGHGTFGRRSDATVQELAFEAFRAAMEDAGIERKDLDASVIGSVPEAWKLPASTAWTMPALLPK